jgi:hypothetical protein
MKTIFHNPFITVNSNRVDLNAAALQKGRVTLDDGACTEQCDGCAEDIAYTGGLSLDGRYIVCECGESYIIIESLKS